MQGSKQTNSPKSHKQSSRYDKIFKENIEAVIPGIIANLLHIHAISTEELPDDIQHTKERKPDVLKKITDSDGETFILQLEFQVADEPDMLFRMAEYYVMLRRKYKLPVNQYVLFVGSGQPKMPIALDEEHLRFSFPLIVFSQLDYELFISSTKPEEIVLAILADFKHHSPEAIVRQVINRIDETDRGDFSLKRYFQQLRVLAQLRNLETQIDKTMDSIAEYINEEKDVLYLRGQRKAKETEQRKFVNNLLKNTDLTTQQIAKNAEVSIEFVRSVQADIMDKQ